MWSKFDNVTPALHSLSLVVHKSPTPPPPPLRIRRAIRSCTSLPGPCKSCFALPWTTLPCTVLLFYIHLVISIYLIHEI